VRLEAERGWDQWALHGFIVATEPATLFTPYGLLLLLAAAIFLVVAVRLSIGARFGQALRCFSGWLRGQSPLRQWLMALLAAISVGASGWLTWGDQAGGVYRRIDSSWQLLAAAAAASIFYVAPSFIFYLAGI